MYKNIAIGVLSLALAYDSKIALRNKKKFQILQEELSSALDRNEYMARKLDEHNVPMTEFDSIALRAM